MCATALPRALSAARASLPPSRASGGGTGGSISTPSSASFGASAAQLVVAVIRRTPWPFAAQVVSHYTGSFAGLFVMFIIPSLLVLAARKKEVCRSTSDAPRPASPCLID